MTGGRSGTACDGHPRLDVCLSMEMQVRLSTESNMNSREIHEHKSSLLGDCPLAVCPVRMYVGEDAREYAPRERQYQSSQSGC